MTAGAPGKPGLRPSRGLALGQEDGHMDLVPLIDCVFLILLFFMLCGRISTDHRCEQISVPPAKTAAISELSQDWAWVVINIFGTQTGQTSRHAIAWNAEPAWKSAGREPDQAYAGYRKLRQKLNDTYDKAGTYLDPKGTGLVLPQVLIEIRADADTDYRIVQETMAVISDTIDPFAQPTADGVASMRPKAPTKPFVHIDFTTRRPDQR